MLTLNYELSHNLVAAEGASRLFVLAKIAAPAIEESRRLPLNIGLTLDTSGSMTGEKLEFACHAAKFLVSQLSREDIFSMVDFNSYINLVFPAEHVHSKDNLKHRIDRISTMGTTNLSGGWLATSKEVLKNVKMEQVNRILLLTDGQANEGVTDPSQLVQIACDLTSRDITTSTIGFGKDFNENLLASIAEGGRGNFHYIDTPEKAPRVFSEELSELLALFAQNLVLTINPSPQVECIGVHHEYPVRQNQKGEIRVELGDIFSLEEKDLIIEFIMPASKAGEKAGVSVLTLSYQQVYENVSFNEVSSFIKVGYGHAQEVASQKINPIVQREMLLCDVVKKSKEAISAADSGNLEAAQESLNASIEGIMNSDFSHEEIFQAEIKRLKQLIANFDSTTSYLSKGRKDAFLRNILLSKKKGMYSKVRSGGIFPPEVIETLKNASSVVVITGPELSTACGMPGPEDRRPGMEKMSDILTYESFERRPQQMWNYIGALRDHIQGLTPDEAFTTIARMEEFWKEFILITTAFDGLHRKAGTTRLVELSGNVFNARCIAERKTFTGHRLNRGGEEKCPCGSYLRPDVLLKGEKVGRELMATVKDTIVRAKVIFLVGASFSQVLPLIARRKEYGAVVMEINDRGAQLATLADFHLGKVPRQILPLLWKEVLK